MSAWDLFEDGFPHGTREGYARGCKGANCPGLLDPNIGIACRGAAMRYSGDFAFRRALDAGQTPAEYLAAERATSEAATVAERAAKRKRPPEPEPEHEPQEPIVPTPPATRDINDPEFPHGTDAGFQRGCTVIDDCPRSPSCREVHREKHRAYQATRAAKKKTTSAGPGAPTPAEVPSSSGEVVEGAEPEEQDARPGTSPLDESAGGIVTPLPRTTEPDRPEVVVPLRRDTPPVALQLVPIADDGYPFTDELAALEAKAQQLEEAAARARAAVNALRGA